MITVIYREKSKDRPRPTVRAGAPTWSGALDIIKEWASTTMVAVAYNREGQIRAYRYRRHQARGSHWERMS